LDVRVGDVASARGDGLGARLFDVITNTYLPPEQFTANTSPVACVYWLLAQPCTLTRRPVPLPVLFHKSCSSTKLPDGTAELMLGGSSTVIAATASVVFTCSVNGRHAPTTDDADSHGADSIDADTAALEFPPDDTASMYG